MKKFLKNIFIVILIIFFLIAFSSSYKSLSIDNLSIVVAMGIDISDNNAFKISFQFTTPSSVSESGTSEKAPSKIYSVDASSISSGINLMNSYVGKEINLSHCKLIAFSEEVAVKGISKEIYTLINDTQVRPSTNIVITKCSADYYLENSKPLFENLLTKYYEVFSNSSQFTGYSSNATIGNFFNSLICHSCQPYAILGGVTTADDENKSTSSSNESNQSTNAEKDSSAISNSSPLSNISNSENIGLAVFNDDVLVGELNSIETLSFLIIKNNLDGFLISVPNPSKTNSYMDLYLTPVNSVQTKVEIVNGSPYITIDCNFTGRIYSMENDSEYLDPKLLEQISDSCNSYLKSVLTDYLYKTSKNLQADINGFGKLAHPHFATTSDFDNYKWNEKYKDAFFNVNVNSSIKSSFLLTES